MDKIIWQSISLRCNPNRAFELFTMNKHLERWLKQTLDNILSPSPGSVDIKKNKTQDGKEIESGAEQTQSFGNKHGVEKKGNNSKHIEEGNERVGPLKFL